MIETLSIDQAGMLNSSFIYSINEESGDIATPYMGSADEPRKVDWQSWVNLGGDMGPAGKNINTLLLLIDSLLFNL